MALASDLPTAAGMSSSSAFMVAVFLALADANDVWGHPDFPDELDETLERSRADVAIQATSSRLTEAGREIDTLLEQGVAVISIAEEMAYPAASSQAEADRINRLSPRLRQNRTVGQDLSWQ